MEHSTWLKRRRIGLWGLPLNALLTVGLGDVAESALTATGNSHSRLCCNNSPNQGTEISVEAVVYRATWNINGVRLVGDLT